MAEQKKDAERVPERRTTQQRWSVQGYILRYPSRRFTPPTDVIELKDRLVVLVEIAGMRTSDFKIALYDQHLIISGYRERPELPEAAYHQAEIGFGEFRLELGLPWAVNDDEVNAQYKRGFLRVDLPRQEDKRMRIVDVTAETDES